MPGKIMFAVFLATCLFSGTLSSSGDAGGAPSSSRRYLSQLPWETRDRLLHLQPHLLVSQLTAAPVPLFRPDQGHRPDYWLVIYNHNEYAILSAGHRAGDRMLLMQGEGEPPVTSLQRQASAAHNSSCSTFLLLTPSPDLNIACLTPQGHRLTSWPLASDVNVSSLWEEMERHNRERGDDNDNDNDSDSDDEEEGGSSSTTTIHFHVISASEPSSFPVADMRDCRIRSLPGQGNGSDVSVQTLCRLLGLECDDSGRVHVHSQRETDYGELYVHLQPQALDSGSSSSSSSSQHGGGGPFQHDLRFEVVADHSNSNSNNNGRGLVVTKRFSLEPYHRAKRQSAYTTYSINDRHLMPNYNQFKLGKCQVGCGPVAWAQIFGYYDRRGHSGTGSSSSQALYRCGADGTTGSNSCQAPASNDNRMKKYIGKLKGILRTFCLFGQGATTQKRMDDVESFFKQRQGSSGDVILEARKFFLTRLVGVYSDSIRDKALGYLRQKWPVIVGFRVSGVFSQHYAVMTQYRTRTVRKRVCKLWVFCKTRTVREYDMYLHMGWGGSRNGWRKAQMFMAAVAKY